MFQYPEDQRGKQLYKPGSRLYQPTYKLGAVGSGALVPTLQVPQNTLQQPSFGRPRGIGLDSTTTSHIQGQGGDGSIGGLVNSLSLVPGAAKGLTWGYDKIFGTPNSEAIAGMEVTGNPKYMKSVAPETFEAVGTTPHSALSAEATPASAEFATTGAATPVLADSTATLGLGLGEGTAVGGTGAGAATSVEASAGIAEAQAANAAGAEAATAAEVAGETTAAAEAGGAAAGMSAGEMAALAGGGIVIAGLMSGLMSGDWDKAWKDGLTLGFYSMFGGE